MFVKLLPAALLLLTACGQSMAQSNMSEQYEDAQHSSDIVRFSTECEKWDDWDKPAKPFHIHGNTWYVGTCGIAAILIVGEDGYALIDSGTEAGADVVLANIQTLGFDRNDVGLLLNSHEHFDHVGGMAKVQEATGGVVISSEVGIQVMATGNDHPDDPQAGMHEPMQPIASGIAYDTDQATALLKAFGLTPIASPGHTPGAMTWQWQSCDDYGCKTIVYADSLSPVSRDDYKFSDHPEYLAQYRAGIARIAALECDILLTPHPSHSRMIERAATGTFEGGMTCAEYADRKLADLEARLAREAGASTDGD